MQWPNWVDLIIVTIFLRACYGGFGRGLLAESINLMGLVAATVIAINYHGLVASWLKPGLWFEPRTGTFLVFCLTFFVVIFVVRTIVRRVSVLLEWDGLHLAVHGLGLVVGAIRGLWWAGLIVVMMTSSGFVYLRNSVRQDSMFGAGLEQLSRRTMTMVVDRFPGAGERADLIPRVM